MLWQFSIEIWATPHTPPDSKDSAVTSLPYQISPNTESFMETSSAGGGFSSRQFCAMKQHFEFESESYFNPLFQTTKKIDEQGEDSSCFFK